MIEKIIHTEANTLVVIAGARQSVQVVCAIRQKGFKGRIFGGPCMGRRNFLEQAANAAEEVVFPLLYKQSKESKRFDEKYTARFGKQPDYTAAHTYDAVNLLIEAIRKAGLNRPRIHDAVRALSPRQGITGKIQWDPLGSNERSVNLGTIRNGRVLLLSHEKSSDSPRSGH